MSSVSSGTQVVLFIIYLLVWLLILYSVDLFEEQAWIVWSSLLIGLVFAYLIIPYEQPDTEEEMRSHRESVNSIAFTIATVSLGMTYLLQSDTIKRDDIRHFYPLILIAFAFSILSVAVYNGKWTEYQFFITSITINLSIGCLLVAVLLGIHSIRSSRKFMIPEED